MKIFPLILIWTILFVAMFISTKEKPPQKPTEEDLKRVDELINNTLKIKQ
jgi:hypothetical protein